jgi:nuclear polyadenylated RNA-binding protein NAB2
MSETLVSGSPQALQLEVTIKNRLGQLAIDEDAESVAQYIVLMICNHKTPSEITLELNGLFGDKFDDGFSTWACQEAEALTKGGDSSQVNAQVQASGYSQTTEQKSADTEMADSGQTFTDYTEEHSQGNPFRQNSRIGGSVPRAPKNFEIRGRNGVNKGSRKLGGHSIGKAFGRPELRERFDADRHSNNNVRTLAGADRPRQRCRHWPNCSYPNCQFPHPTARCFKFPNCPNPMGTCAYLHEGEDPTPEQVAQMNAALLAPPVMPGVPANGVNGASPAFVPGNHNMQYMSQGPNGGTSHQPPTPKIIVCKFAERCSSKTCTLGHPNSIQPAHTPVKEFVWCENGVECKDASCFKAHPSASQIRTPEPLPDKSLATCKFADKCTNWNCSYRHPRTPVVCREGSECKRVDCFFTHPIDEECKFGANCSRPNCVYRHPEGQQPTAVGVRAKIWVNTNDRKFAADEDEVMEKVIPGNA